VLEKLLIESVYWERRGIPWKVGTELDLPLTRVKNLDLLRTSLVAKELDWLSPRLQIFVEHFMSHWMADQPLLSILRIVSAKLMLELEQSFALFGRAVWLRLLPVDIDSEIIHHQRPLCRAALREGNAACRTSH
jgi:hypothetical protein